MLVPVSLRLSEGGRAKYTMGKSMEGWLGARRTALITANLEGLSQHVGCSESEAFLLDRSSKVHEGNEGHMRPAFSPHSQ